MSTAMSSGGLRYRTVIRRGVEFLATLAIVCNALTLVPASAGASVKTHHGPAPAATYTVTYAPNGGTAVPSDATKYAASATVSVKSAPLPTKTNCTFTGYTLTTSAPAPHDGPPGATVIAYANGAFTPSTFKIASNVTLTAQFDCSSQFTVTYNPNGGGGTPVDVGHYAKNAVITVPTSPIPTKAGCAFIGYVVDRDGDGDATTIANAGGDDDLWMPYSNGTFTPSNFTILGNALLTAQWGCFTVTYTGGDPVDPNFYGAGQQVTVLGPPAATGCTFLGYNLTVVGGTGTTGTGGWSGPSGPRHAGPAGGDDVPGATTVTIAYRAGKFTPSTFVLTGNTTLTPVYACYTVTYNANGGSGAPVDSNSYAPNAKVTVAPGTGMTAPPATCFAGWATSSNATTPNYLAGSNFTITVNTTLYAVWASCYTVTYNANGGTNPPVDPKNPYGAGAPVTVLAAGSMAAPGANYRFSGWALTANATTAKYQPGSRFTITTTTTLYAVWTLCLTGNFTVTYDPNGGSGTPVDANSYANGATVTLAISPIPTKTGCTFIGYLGNFDDDDQSDDGSDQGPYGANSFFAYANGRFTPATFHIDQNATLVAQWTCTQNYTVTYNANGGASAPVDNHSPYAAGATVTVLSKGAMTGPTGCTFSGWSTSPSATTATYVAANTFTINANTTLYAVWSPCSTSTVTYGANGGSGALVDPSSPYVPGSTVTVLGQGSITAPAGCSFAGWATNPTATSATYVAGNTFTINANTTLFAVWNPCSTYTVTYDANGGSGAPVDPSSPYVPASTVTVLAKGSMSAPAGCTFAGWSTNPAATSATYVAGNTFTINANTTFFAVWNPCTTYAVTYDANGGSGAPVDTSSPYTPGSTVTVLTKGAMTPPAGCTFSGWSTSPSATTATYVAGSTFVIGASVTLYAVWSPCSTYSVTYNANGGTGEPVDHSSPYTPGSTVTVLSGSSMTPPAGCTFAGWQSGTGTNYAPGATFTITANTVLYAVWTPCNTFTVTYNANGGSGAPVDPTNPYVPGATVTVLTKGAMTAPSGCTFAGWSTNPSAASATYVAGNTFTIASNTTLYAVWSPCASYTVTYNANGGSGAPVDPSSPYTSGSTVTVLSGAGLTAPAGCTFAGWVAGTGSTYAPGQTFTVTGNVTLYASWTPCTTFTVTYDANGGSGAPVDGFSPYVPGSTVTVLNNLGMTGPTGCAFAGWATNSSANVATYRGGDTFTISANTTLYAVWAPCNTYTVTYNANGGSGAPTDPTSPYVPGSTVTVLPGATLTGPPGCSFGGWGTTSGATYNPGDTFSITGNVTLYALWVSCSTFTVTYDANGGTNPPTDGNVYAPGSTVSVLSNLGMLSPAGCTFAGWSTSPSAQVASYVAGASFAINANTTLYAVWHPCSTYTVTYNPNGGSGSVTDPNHYAPGSSATVLDGASLTPPTGCSFDGWTTNGITIYDPASTVPVAGNVTLYALWSPCITYTVTYDANGGSGAPVDGFNPYIPGASVTALGGFGMTGPSGCTFAGWSTDSNAQTATYAAGAVFTINASLTLYAIWNPCSHYTVTYNANGGSGAPTDPSSPYVPGSTVTVLGGGTLVAPIGCTFAGWSTTGVSTYVTGATFTINSNITLYAIWTNCQTYTVTYDANGGSGAPTDQAGPYVPGATVTVLPGFVMTPPNGCSFAGWSTDSNATTGTYVGGSTFSIDGNTTLFAIWHPCVTYGVHYNLNGGTGTTPTDSNTYTPNSPVTAKPGTGLTPPAGCTFAGWTIDGSNLIGSSTLFNITSNVTLYAVWDPCTTYTVTYDANGGLGAPVDNLNPYVPGSTVTVVSSVGMTGPSGCTFAGWSTDPNATSATYVAASTFTIDASLTLYAVWHPCSHYTVTYNANGGTGTVTDPQSPHAPSSTVTVLGGGGLTPPAGCTFAGWTTNRGTTYTAGNTFTINSNVTLYAVWSDCVTYTVTYDANGGSGAPTDTANPYVPGSTATALASLGMTGPVGCTFGGWATTSNAQTASYSAGDTFTVNANITLYAVWHPCSTYHVTYNANGGTGTVPTDGTQYTPGETTTVKSASGLTPPAGCSFGGWSANGSTVYNPNDTFAVNGNVTLFALWTGCTNVYVYYNANGGTGAPTDSNVYTSGATVTVLSSLGMTAPTGCTFAGWSTDQNATVGTYVAANTFTITQTTTLYAVWHPCSTYHVTYNANGGSGAPTDSTAYTPGQSSTVRSGSGMIPPTGCSFAGWKSSTNTSFTAGSTFTVNGNVTLYATWSCTQYTVIYDPNGATGAPVDANSPYFAGSTVVVLNGLSLVAPATCSFGGWSTDKNASNGTYHGGETFTITGNVTFYAIWVSCRIYTVTYNANGGSNAPSDVGGPYAKGSTVNVLGQGLMTGPTGCGFAGWSTNQSASTPDYVGGSSFALTGDVVLYAVWHPCVTYTVTFNPNGGFNPPANEGPFQPGAPVPVPGQGSMTGPTGCSFLGWSTNPGAIVAQYVAPGTFPAASNAALYAVWGDCARYSVTYDANGGLNPPSDTTQYHSGQTFTVKGPGSMTSAGCSFAGWSTDQHATVPNHTIGGNYTVNANVTLYAIWSGCVKLTVVIHGGNVRNCGKVILHGHTGTYSMHCGPNQTSVTVAKAGTIATIHVPSQANFETVWQIRDPKTGRMHALPCSGSTCRIPMKETQYVVVSYVGVPVFLFDTDVYHVWHPLTKHQRAILLGQLEAFVHDGVTKVNVAGYADPRSSVAYNRVLSYHRAHQVVVTYLAPLARRFHLKLIFHVAPMGETSKFETFQADRSVRLSAG